MSAKFHDKLAEQALEQALNSHAEAIQQRDSLYTDRESMKAKLLNIGKELSELTKQRNGGLPAGTDLSTAAIDALLDRQVARIGELNKAQSNGKLRINMLQQAYERSSVKATEAKHEIDLARATLAASFERHVLNLREVKAALELLRRVKATWVASVDGPWFDNKTWAAELLQERPNDKEYADARALLRFPNE